MLQNFKNVSKLSDLSDERILSEVRSKNERFISFLTNLVKKEIVLKVVYKDSNINPSKILSEAMEAFRKDCQKDNFKFTHSFKSYMRMKCRQLCSNEKKSQKKHNSNYDFNEEQINKQKIPTAIEIQEYNSDMNNFLSFTQKTIKDMEKDCNKCTENECIIRWIASGISIKEMVKKMDIKRGTLDKRLHDCRLKASLKIEKNYGDTLPIRRRMLKFVKGK